MAQQESFKKRIRARMEKTGERYVAARRVLIEQSRDGRRQWVSDPETSNEAVLAATGRSYDDWCDLIEAWPGHSDGHTAIAAFLARDLGLDGWWAQTVTVGYERITGRRLPHQQADGTFTANKSRTVTVDAALLQDVLRDDAGRGDLFPGISAVLRSSPEAKTVRLDLGTGIVQIAVEPRSDGRAKVTIQHERLPTASAVDEWKFYWSEWLDAIDAG